VWPADSFVQAATVGENVFAVHNAVLCQYGAVVKSRINFNILVDNIVEIIASTCLSALLRKIYTGCTHVSALLKLFLIEGIDDQITTR